MTSPAAPAPFDWESEGRRVGAALDQFHCIAVLGDGSQATALVALGIARAQSATRRVALADLIGEAEPLQRLLPLDADPHGIVDSFTYGVSLNRVAQPIDEQGELFLLPTGTDDIDYEKILPSDRWARLAAGFREVGALLVIAAPAWAPGVEKLVDMAEGAILVGDAVPAKLPVAKVIASVRRPRVTSAGVAGGPPPVAAAPEKPATPAPNRRRTAFIAGGVATLVLLLAGGGWLGLRQVQRNRAADSVRAADSTRVADSTAKAAAAPPAAPDTAITVPPGDVPAIANPSDSASALRFSVAWLKLNTLSGAIMELAKDGEGLPAATFVTYDIGQTRWFELRVGGYAARPEAESLLVTLQGNGLVPPGNGNVIEAPLGLVVDSVPSAEGARTRIAALRQRDVPAYALQGKQRVRIYVGAYKSPLEAMVEMERLRAAGLTPVLAYRIGRVL